jgi:hypothetical protein
MSYLRITRRNNTTRQTVRYTFHIKFYNGIHQLINKQTDEVVYADGALNHVRQHAQKNGFVVVPVL